MIYEIEQQCVDYVDYQITCNKRQYLVIVSQICQQCFLLTCVLNECKASVDMYSKTLHRVLSIQFYSHTWSINITYRACKSNILRRQGRHHLLAYWHLIPIFRTKYAEEVRKTCVERQKEKKQEKCMQVK